MQREGNRWEKQGSCEKLRERERERDNVKKLRERERG